MAGAVVNQMGFIDSSTSVADNGSGIDLLADYNANPNGAFAGTSTSSLGDHAGVQSGVDWRRHPGRLQCDSDYPRHLGHRHGGGDATIALSSIVDIRGTRDTPSPRRATREPAPSVPTSGAVIFAPGAAPSLDSSNNVISETNTRNQAAGSMLTSGVTLNTGDWNLLNQNSAVEQDVFVNDKGQIYLDSGAQINVAGSDDVSASVTENVVSVQLRGPQLANSPLQQNGALRGQTVQIDLRQFGSYDGQEWVGTPLADTSGYVGLVQRSIGELTDAGGTVSLTAGDSVVLQQGSSIDVSGGWINYAGGVVQTTEVISGGHLYNISQATPNLVYSGIYTGTTSTTDPKWNVTQSRFQLLGARVVLRPGVHPGRRRGIHLDNCAGDGPGRQPAGHHRCGSAAADSRLADIPLHLRGDLVHPNDAGHSGHSKLRGTIAEL